MHFTVGGRRGLRKIFFINPLRVVGLQHSNLLCNFPSTSSDLEPTNITSWEQTDNLVTNNFNMEDSRLHSMETKSVYMCHYLSSIDFKITQ